MACKLSNFLILSRSPLFVLPFLFPGALKENQKVQKNLQKCLDFPAMLTKNGHMAVRHPSP